MSLSECERFAADLKSNAALRGEAEKAEADKSHGTLLSSMVAFAMSKGYGITADDAKGFFEAGAAAGGKHLTDAELDGVSGGPSLLT